jgi:hypothetical protein
MADAFDPYRERLIMETETVWPAGYEHLSAAEKRRLEALLHAAPEKASQLDYVRMHTGFCRKITVMPADIERIAG